MRLNSFHHRCVHTVLGIINQRHREERISSVAVREQWEDVETTETKLMGNRLEWLGHLAQMQDHRLPKMCLFRWLPQTRPCGGPRRRWRDIAKKDLKSMQVGKDWYSVTQDRGKWRSAWGQNLAERQIVQQRGWLTGEKNLLCDVCGTRFRQKNDKARHNCAARRRRPVCEQEGAVQCEECRKWFCSRGGLVVRRCRREEVVEDGAAGGAGAGVSQGLVECRECGRTFSR